MNPAPVSVPDPGCAAPLATRLLVIAAVVGVLGTGLLLGAHSLGELDIWLHHRAGTDLLAGEGLPTQNTYSFTAGDHPWTNHEWLFQVLAAVCGPRAGSPGLDVTGWNLLRLGLTGLLLGIVVLGDGRARSLWKGVPAGLPGPWLLPGLVGGLLLLWPRLTLRPELVSYILLVLLVRQVERVLATDGGPMRLKDLLSPGRPVGGAFWLTVLWAQFHGFSALAPALWLLAGVTALAGRVLPAGGDHRPPWRLWTAGLGLLVAAQLLTPNGVRGLLYPLTALGQFAGDGADLRQSISELAPLLDTRDALGLTLLAFRISLVWGAVLVLLRRGAMGPFRIVLWILAAVAALQAQRNIGIYALVFMLLHTGSAAPLFPRPRRWPARPGPDSAWSAGGAVLALALSAWFALSVADDTFYLREGVSRRTGFGLTPARFSAAAVDLAARQTPPRIFTNVDGAAFLIDRTRIPVYIDGRTEAYPADLWRRYEVIKTGSDAALAELRRVAPLQVYLTLGSTALRPLLDALLAAPDFRPVQADEAGVLFAPAPTPSDGKALLDSLDKALPPPPTTLAGARLADVWLGRAALAGLAGAADRREAALRRALDARADHPTAAHNLGNVKLGREDFAGALTLFETALATNPRLAGSALNAGVCLLRLDRPTAAAGYFETAASLQPGNFQAWVNLGVARQRQNDFPGAIRAFERALDLNPRHTAVRRALDRLKAAPGR